MNDEKEAQTLGNRLMWEVKSTFIGTTTKIAKTAKNCDKGGSKRNGENWGNWSVSLSFAHDLWNANQHKNFRKILVGG